MAHESNGCCGCESSKEDAELSHEAAQQQNRSLSYGWDDDGSLVIKARLPAEAGAVVLKALDRAVDEINRNEIGLADRGCPRGVSQVDVRVAVSQPVHPCTVVPLVRRHIECLRKGIQAHPHGTSFPKSTLAMRRADALSLMAESLLAHGVEEMSGGDKHQVVVHVSAETLKGTIHSVHPERVEGCEFEVGPSMAVETARRLACDASIVTMTEDEEGNPLDVGRKTRSIPPALQRALNARDRGCRFPGCCNTRYLHGHHIEHWANGGETKLRNLVSLCRFHHRLVHEGGVRIEVLDDGAFRFVKPDGDVYENKRLERVFDASHVTQFGSSLPAQCTDATCDYGLCIDGLLHRVRLLQLKPRENVPCGTF